MGEKNEKISDSAENGYVLYLSQKKHIQSENFAVIDGNNGRGEQQI